VKGLAIGQAVGGASAMLASRNRKRPAPSFEERLLKFAEEARAAAKIIAASSEQEKLLRKALKAEALANAAERLQKA